MHQFFIWLIFVNTNPNHRKMFVYLFSREGGRTLFEDLSDVILSNRAETSQEGLYKLQPAKILAQSTIGIGGKTLNMGVFRVAQPISHVLAIVIANNWYTFQLLVLQAHFFAVK